MSQTAFTNPWLSMWFRPVRAIRWVIKTNPKYGVFWLSTVYILQNLFFLLNFWSAGFSFHFVSLLVPSLLLAPALGVVWVVFYGWILRVIGRLLGGDAPSSHIRAALAWSRIPAMISLTMWLFLVMIHRESAYIQYTGELSALLINLVFLILHLWTLILLVESIRAVQHFTRLRSLCNVFIAAAIYSLIVFFVMLIVRFFYLM